MKSTINSSTIIFYSIFSGGEPVTGIGSSAFDVLLYDPDDNEVSNTIGYTITELGGGHYKLTTIIPTIGVWFLAISHPSYPSEGKSYILQIHNIDKDNINTFQEQILGLSHENVYIDQPVYDSNNNLVSARLRIYLNAGSVGSNYNVIDTYQITSIGNGTGRFTYWKQIK